ncbi:toll/interleukin-1 receptor domain-containing protein [Acinetobacter tandoii]
MSTQKKPKVFLSYSWSSPEHEDWVLDLAHRLHNDNIHIVIDKWDLREGQSSAEFMESMVVDPTIDKIIMVIDNTYQQKADSRDGGVGTESTILSNLLYSKISTNNVVAIIAEPGSKPPVFYSSRIYIDLSSEEKLSENYENLIRWIYGKFKHERPKTEGITPSFIHENLDSVVLYTNMEFRNALDEVERGKPTAQGAIRRYLNKLESELPKLTIDETDDPKKAFLDNFSNFTAHLLEYKKLLNAACEYQLEQKTLLQFQKFLASLLKLPNLYQTNLNYSFYEALNYQLILVTIAVLIKNDEFAIIKHILDEIYEVPTNHRDFHDEKYTTFKIFNPTESKEIGEVLNKPNYIEPLTELISQFYDNEVVTFQELCEADLILYLKSASKTIQEKREFVMWWPHLTFYINNQRHPTKLFARAENPEFLEKLCFIFNSKDLSLIDSIYKSVEEKEWGAVYIPVWRSPLRTFLNIKTLTNFEKLKPS